MDQVNDSLVQDLFEAKVGQRISSREIRQAFDRAFGAGAGQKVEVACAKDINQGGRVMVQELRILLTGKVEPGTKLADLLRDAPEAIAGCSSGLVDQAGVDQ
jgi:ribonuclease T2